MEVRAKVIDRIQYSWLVVRACVRLAKVFSFLKIISARILNWSILCRREILRSLNGYFRERKLYCSLHGGGGATTATKRPHPA